MPNINDLYRKNTRRTIDPAKRAEGIKKVVSFFNAIRDAYQRNHCQNQSEQDSQTDKDNIRTGSDDDSGRVQQQRLGQLDDTESIETNGGGDIKEFVERVFLRRMPDK